jgi:rod shape-determining protein MreC
LRERHATLAFIIASIALIALMAAQARRPDGRSALAAGVSAVTSPVVSAVLGVADGIRTVYTGYVDVLDARRERDELAAEVERLRARLVEADELERQNRRLRELLDLREGADLDDAVVGRVVADLSGGPLRHAVRVDVGRAEGIGPGSVMLHRGSVAGRVLEATQHHADVLLLLDPDSGVAVRHQDERFAGVLRGGNRGFARIASLAYVPRDQDVAVGDVLVTSGLDGLYPPGLRVGRVAMVEGSSPLTWKIDVVVDVDPSAMEEVLVLPARERRRAPREGDAAGSEGAEAAEPRRAEAPPAEVREPAP